jgi:serine/threonine-protein kinase
VPELPEERPGTRFAGYELIAWVARGGMGEVYQARKAGLDRVVALKRVIGGHPTDETERQRFRAEAQAASALDHPNIVPIYEVGEHDGCPFFTMKLMLGGNLAQRLAQVRADRQRACALVATVARAVHHGHQRGILHRDLKPANILLDEAGAPHVADFGTAKHLEHSHGLTRSGALVGTPNYMAPEQARSDAGSLTVAADVHGLGAILYELLTGRPPYLAETDARTLQLLLETEPAKPRGQDASIPADLETICLTCLEKAPERRYRSAEALADELDRFLRGEPIEARPIGRVERAWRWSKRHPLLAGALAAAAIASATTLYGANAQAEDLRRDVLAADEYAARMAAGTVLLRFREYADHVRKAALDSTLIGYLERADYAGLAAAEAPAWPRPSGSFAALDSYIVLDPQCFRRGRWPHLPDLDGSFDFRDYCQGAQTLGRAKSREVHVSRAFKSKVDGHMKFGFSTPVYASDGRWVGVLVAVLATDAALGGLELSPASVLGPRETTKDEPGDKYVVLVHSGLEYGQTLEFDASYLNLQKLAAPTVAAARDLLVLPAPNRVLSTGDYRDPVPGYEGRWLAGLAPIGDTGLVMVVATRNDAALQPMRDLGVRLAVPLAAFVLLAGVAWLLGRRRRGAAARTVA